MEAIGEKWKRMAKELFDVFSKAMTENGYVVKEVVHPVFHPKNIQDMFKMGVTRSDIEEMIIFSVQNWDRLRGLHNMKNLAHEPCFNQMLSTFKYPTLIYISKTGFESAPVKEDAKNSSATASSKNISSSAKSMIDTWTRKSSS